jgi:hypothetical protein
LHHRITMSMQPFLSNCEASLIPIAQVTNIGQFRGSDHKFLYVLNAEQPCNSHSLLLRHRYEAGHAAGRVQGDGETPTRAVKDAVDALCAVRPHTTLDQDEVSGMRGGEAGEWGH